MNDPVHSVDEVAQGLIVHGASEGLATFLSQLDRRLFDITEELEAWGIVPGTVSIGLHELHDDVLELKISAQDRQT